MSKHFLSALLCVTCAVPIYANVRLPSIISDHMVLQKTARTPIWGAASPGEEVAVSLDRASAKTRAGADGKWRVDLDLSKEGEGPFPLTVSGSNRITVSDVVVGDVWLASGQSNMEFQLSRAETAATEIPQSANPVLRQFLVSQSGVAQPVEDCAGKWEAASPETSGRFTAVGYYFGKAIQRQMKTPVGIINASYGGSNTEAWISGGGLDRDPELKEAKEKLWGEADSYPQRMKEYAGQFRAWAAQYGREDRPSPDAQGYAAPNISMEGWKPVTLPGFLAKAGLPDSGVVWLRKTFTIPQGMAGSYMTVTLSLPHDFDAVYFNGVKIGETTPGRTTSPNFGVSSNNNRRYDVPGNQVKAGEATLAIRLYSPAGGAGIEPAAIQAGSLKLGGEWLAKTEFELPALDAAARAACPERPKTPPHCRAMAGYLFNGMIHPLLPYAIKGVIWYQGETNAWLGYQQRTTFQTLIQDWRTQWQQDNLPFYWCQIPNFGAKTAVPGNSEWAELREAQSMALKLPQTGQAVLMGLGEEADIHSRDKADVGDRLSRVALAKTYHQPVAYSGPVFRSMRIEGNKVRLQFDFAEGLSAQPLPKTYLPKSLDPGTVKPLVLNSPESQVQGFAICGADSKFVWANAQIDGSSVIVSAPGVGAPVAVRYAWGDNPTCNLINQEGLPAAPFRTDDFPLVSFAKRYGK